MGMKGALVAGAIADAARNWSELAYRFHTDRQRQKEADRIAGNQETEALIRLADQPGYSVEMDGVTPPSAPRSTAPFQGIGQALMGLSSQHPVQRTATDYRNGPSAIGAALTQSDIPSYGAAMTKAAGPAPARSAVGGVDRIDAGVSVAPPPASPEPQPTRRPLGQLNFGTGRKYNVSFDPSKTPGALSALAKRQDSEATAKRNREAFDLLKTVDPDSYSDDVFVPDVDWAEELKRVLPARGRQASLRGAGWSESEAHTEGFHTTNLREDRRSEAGAVRAAEDQTFQRENRSLEGALGYARTMAENGGSQKVIFDAMSKIPKYKSIPPDQLQRVIAQAGDATAVARNRPEGPRGQPQDPRVTERRRGVVDLIGRAPVDELEQQAVDELVNGSTPEQVIATMREAQLDSAQIAQVQRFLQQYGIRRQTR